MPIRQHYLELLELVGISLRPKDGCTEAALAKAEEHLGVRLPDALREYYLLCGRHELNRAHNELIEPAALCWESDHLTFLVENQAVVVWGIARDDCAKPDPPVFQAEHSKARAWSLESKTASRFLSTMLCWQFVNGGAPHCAVVLEARLPKGFPSTGWREICHLNDVRCYTFAHALVCISGNGSRVQINAGASAQSGIEAAQAALHVAWDWSSAEET